MKSQKIDISRIKKNPANPRTIKDDKFKNLVKSLKDFPEMMELRPVVVNKEMMILGGNMRYDAAKEAGWEKIDVVIANNLDEAKQKEFIIKDNVQGGEWNFDLLANEFQVDDLTDWGFDKLELEDDETKIKEEKLLPFNQSHILISFPPEKLIEIQELIEKIKEKPYIEIEQSSN